MYHRYLLKLHSLLLQYKLKLKWKVVLYYCIIIYVYVSVDVNISKLLHIKQIRFAYQRERRISFANILDCHYLTIVLYNNHKVLRIRISAN